MLCDNLEGWDGRGFWEGRFKREEIYVYLLIGEGNGTPLQYSCLENPMDGGAWWAAVHGVTKSRTRLSDFAFTFTYLWLIHTVVWKRPIQHCKGIIIQLKIKQ